MDEPRACYTEWSKSEIENQILYQSELLRLLYSAYYEA